MALPESLRNVLVLLAPSWALLPSVAVAQEGVTGAPCSLADLTRMSWAELEALYRAAGPGPIPHGYARGRALYCRGRPLSGPRSAATRLLWHGKHFDDGGGSLVN